MRKFRSFVAFVVALVVSFVAPSVALAQEQPFTPESTIVVGDTDRRIDSARSPRERHTLRESIIMNGRFSD